MGNEAELGAPRGWKTTQAYAIAATCLVIGIALGYLFRGSAARPVLPSQTAQMQSPAGASAGTQHQMDSLEDMKRMADKKAEPLLVKLRANPNNSELLNQIVGEAKSQDILHVGKLDAIEHTLARRDRPALDFRLH